MTLSGRSLHSLNASSGERERSLHCHITTQLSREDQEMRSTELGKIEHGHSHLYPSIQETEARRSPTQGLDGLQSEALPLPQNETKQNKTKALANHSHLTCEALWSLSIAALRTTCCSGQALQPGAVKPSRALSNQSLQCPLQH